MMLQKAWVSASFVEPNPAVFSQLRKNVLKAEDGQRHRAINAAICQNTSSVVPLYVVSEEYSRELPRAPRWARTEINSMVRDNVLRGLRHARYHLNISDLPRYVKEVPVQCLTPEDLVQHAKFTMADVRVLIVDVEGLDVSVVQAFMRSPGFQADAIVFESKVVRSDAATRGAFKRLRRAIVQRGYSTDELFPNFYAWNRSRVPCGRCLQR
jgi:FkbM family methyltransferase